MRVTGDCFLAGRVLDFFVADFRAPPDRAATLVAIFRFVADATLLLVFAVLLVRAVARLDADVDLRRALAPDDFDAVAMINSSRKVREACAQDSRAVSSPTTLSGPTGRVLNVSLR
jgi:hypothetical protein